MALKIKSNIVDKIDTDIKYEIIDGKLCWLNEATRRWTASDLSVNRAIELGMCEVTNDKE